MSWRRSLPRPRLPFGRRNSARVSPLAGEEGLPADPAGDDVEELSGDGAEEAIHPDAAVAAAPATHSGPLHLRHPGDSRPLVAQPVIAMRARRHLAMISIGLVCAVTGALCVVWSSMSLLRLTDASRLWPGAANAIAVICALIALLQWRLWALALKEWEGVKDVGLGTWVNVSASGVWLSVIGALLMPVAMEQVVRESTSAEPAWWLALAGGSLVILGVALAGSHRLHPRGPRGVPPLIRRNNRRPAEQWAVLPAAAGPLEDNDEAGSDQGTAPSMAAASPVTPVRQP